MRISDWSSDVCSSDLADVENSECVESEGIRLADDVEKRCDLGRAGAETDLRQAVPDFLVAVKNARDVVHGSGRAFREAANGTLARTSSEARSVGKEWVSTCSSRWWPAT